MSSNIQRLSSSRFPPVGECIYCGSKKELQNEHIIAYSLNGNAILPKASCKKCAVITLRIEEIFARGPARAMRAALGFQTRRKKEMPKSFPVVLHKNGTRQQVEIPLSQFPVILQLPLFPEPGLLTGKHDGIPIKSKGTLAVSLKQNTSPTQVLQEIGRRYRAEGIELPAVDPKAFAKLIAKSAYALAVAYNGLSNIKDKYVVPAILNNTDDLGTWVGSSAQPFAPDVGEHITQVKTFRNPTTGEEIICVLMKLFSYLPVPGYVIIPASRR